MQGRESGSGTCAKSNSQKALIGLLRWHRANPQVHIESILVNFDQCMSPTKARALSHILNRVVQGDQIILSVNSVCRLAHDWRRGARVLTLLDKPNFVLIIAGERVLKARFIELMDRHAESHKRRIARNHAWEKRTLIRPVRESPFYTKRPKGNFSKKWAFDVHIAPVIHIARQRPRRGTETKRGYAKRIAEIVRARRIRPFQTIEYSDDRVRRLLENGIYQRLYTGCPRRTKIAASMLD